MSPITTHVLDTSTGNPGQGMPITLSQKQPDGSYNPIASGVTDDDGRIRDLLAPGALKAGVYKMSFDTETYFKLHGQMGFYPEAVICFAIVAPQEHYHIPLLLSPYGYTTYRGS